MGYLTPADEQEYRRARDSALAANQLGSLFGLQNAFAQLPPQTTPQDNTVLLLTEESE